MLLHDQKLKPEMFHKNYFKKCYNILFENLKKSVQAPHIIPH